MLAKMAALAVCLCLGLIGIGSAIEQMPVGNGGSPIVIRAPNEDMWFTHNIPNNPHNISGLPEPWYREDDYNYTCGWQDTYVVSIYNNRILYQFGHHDSDGTYRMYNNTEVIDEPLLLSFAGTNLSCDLFPDKNLKSIKIAIGYPVRSITVEGEES